MCLILIALRRRRSEMHNSSPFLPASNEPTSFDAPDPLQGSAELAVVRRTRPSEGLGRALEAQARSQVDLSAAWTAVAVEVLAAIADTYLLTERPLSRFASMLISMFAHFERRGVKRLRNVTGDLTLEWCWSPVQGPDGSAQEPARNFARDRQWVARAAFKVAAQLGAQLDPNVAAGTRIKRNDPDVPARPLTDQELDRVCAHVDAGTAASRRALLVAMYMAGGSAAEAAAVRARDIDLDAGTVTFLGERARVCALDEWSARAIARYLRANSTAPDERLCVKADTPRDAAVDSVSIRMWKILKEAGFSSRSGISARSVRLAAARQVLERDGIVATARFLGSPSLDNTAHALGHDWQSQHGTACLAALDSSARPSGAAGSAGCASNEGSRVIEDPR